MADLEDSVQLGLGYPHGPLDWGDPRYRPRPWLVRRVGLGLPLTTPEAAR